jgi:hypothetical protein
MTRRGIDEAGEMERGGFPKKPIQEIKAEHRRSRVFVTGYDNAVAMFCFPARIGRPSPDVHLRPLSLCLAFGRG